MMKQTVKVFFKFQISSLIATLVAFSITILLKEAGGLYYLLSTSAGSIVGGVVSFVFGRKWVFKVSSTPTNYQILRFFFVWGGSILLNIMSVFLLTSFGHLNYLFSKGITAVIVGVFFNYSLQKKYVFSLNHEIRETTNI